LSPDEALTEGLRDACRAFGKQLCPRCRCCSLDRQDCYFCGGDGFDDVDGRGERRDCHNCQGDGYVSSCTCDAAGEHGAVAP
jgi:hypothetical protein